MSISELRAGLILLCKVNSRHPRQLLALLGAEKFVRLARRHCDCRWKIGLGTDLVMSGHLLCMVALLLVRLVRAVHFR